MIMNGFLDLQVNGYGGVDFNQDALTGEQLHTACERLAADGVSGILATIITDHIEVMAHRLSTLVKLRERDDLAQRLIVGLHIEGPFLNEQPGYRGAHPADAIHPANADEMKRLLDAAGGLTRIATLAPERDPGFQVTRLLAAQRIVVSAGHCDPTLDQLRAAIDAGVTMFTHVGNGCPMQLHRHDNIIHRALSLHDKLWLCFIADGAHVPFPALGNYLRSAGLERCIVVTDAIAPAGLGPGRYTISRWEVDVGEDLVVWAPDRSHLIGSAITMRQAFKNLTELVGFSKEDAARLTAENPCRAMRL